MKRHRLKLVVTIVVTLLFTLLFTFGITIQNIYTVISRNKTQVEMKLDAFDKTLTELQDTFDKTLEDMRKQYEIKAMLSASAMQNIIQTEGDKAIMLYGDGAVIRVEGDEIIAPSHLDKRLNLNTDFFTNSNDIIESFAEEDTSYLISYSRIGNTNYFFLTWERGVSLYDAAYSRINLEETLRSKETAYNTYVIIADPDIFNEGKYVFSYKPEIFSDITEFDQIGFNLDQMRETELYLYEYKGQLYQFVLDENSENGRLTIMVLPIDNALYKSVRQTSFVSILMTILLISFVVGCYSLYSYVRDHSLPPVLEKRYNPSRVRRFCALYGLLGLLLLVISGSLVYSLNELLDMSESSKETLHILEERISAIHENEENRSSNTENIYVEYAEHIARLMDIYPQLRNTEMLSDIADQIQASSITLYDSSGRETLSSAGFINLALSTDSTKPSYDFRRLLKGVHSIIHAPMTDELTGEEYVQIGVSIGDTDHPGTYGAMIISVPPSVIQSAEPTDISMIMQHMSAEDTLFFAADRETAVITSSSDPALIGEDISSIGLDKDDLQGAMMNYINTLRGKCFIVSEPFDESILYFARAKTDLDDGRVQFLFLSSISFLIVYALLALILLRKYNKYFFDEFKAKGEKVETGENEVITPAGRAKLSVDPSRRWSSLRGLWHNMLPEQKGLAVAQFLAAFFIITSLINTIKSDSLNTRRSLYYYLTAGDWTHGWNAFAAASIVLLGAELLLGVIIVRLILRVLEALLGTKGETICRLINNLVEYIAVLCFLYFSLTYLGVDTRALLASVSLLTLAVSLGAKDLVADVLAGITIVFEGEFQVGDIVDIGGFQGQVTEIGVRSTKILGQGGNIKIIGNQDVKGVINMTQLNSWYASEITLSADLSLDELEKILAEELPKIGERYTEIVSGPTYKGVTGIGKGTMTITILTECRQENYRLVQREVNRALHRLFERHGIKI